MVIPIPVGRRYRSTMSGWVWRPVHCEHCGCDFAYKMQIVGHGSSTSPLYLNNEGAKSAASRSAQDNFQHQMRNSFIAVDCPDCGELQQNMVSQLKWNRWRLLIGPGIALAVAYLYSQTPTQYIASDSFGGGVFFAGLILFLVCLILVMYKAYFQCLYPVILMVVLILAAANVVNLIPFLVPLGLLFLLIDAILALRYDPHTNPYRIHKPRKYKPQVARRSEFEAAAAKVKAETGKILQIPSWS